MWLAGYELGPFSLVFRPYHSYLAYLSARNSGGYPALRTPNQGVFNRLSAALSSIVVVQSEEKNQQKRQR